MRFHSVHKFMNILMWLDEFWMLVSNQGAFEDVESFTRAFTKASGLLFIRPTIWRFCSLPFISSTLKSSLFRHSIIFNCQGKCLNSSWRVLYNRDRLLSIDHDGGKGHISPVFFTGSVQRRRYVRYIKIYIILPGGR